MAKHLRIESDPGIDPLSQYGSDSVELGRFDESFVFNDRKLAQIERCVVKLYYEWGFDLKEIGDCLGVSESRISQMHAQALRAQKKELQIEVSRDAQGSGKREESKSVSQSIQDRSVASSQKKISMAEVSINQGHGLGECAIEEVSEEVFEAFGVDAF